MGDAVELSVRDTGVGIPTAELPRLFQRFYRVSGTRSRTHEGSGIGLAFVKRLVELHQGSIDVTSIEGAGTCFTITIPTGTAHLPPDRIGATRTLISTAIGANGFVEEAASWVSLDMTRLAAVSPELIVQSSNRQFYPSSTLNSIELLVRVEVTLKLAQMRRAATQREQALRLEAETAKTQVESILTSIRDGFYVLDLDWCHTYVNDRLCEMAGMSRAEMIGRNVWELFPPPSRLRCTDIFIRQCAISLPSSLNTSTLLGRSGTNTAFIRHRVA